MENFPQGNYSGLGVIVAGLVGGAYWLMKRLPGMFTDIANDRAEKDMIAILQKERDEYRQRWQDSENARNELVREVSEFRGQVGILNEQIKHLSLQVETLKMQLGWRENNDS